MRKLCIALAVCLVPAFAQEEQLLKQVQTLPLTGIDGPIGHLAVDLKGGRLFVAANGGNSVEVLDLKQGTLLQSVKGFSKPRDILPIPGSPRVYVSADGGKLQVFDSTTWQQLKTIELGGNVGRLKYDLVSKRIYAAFGDGSLAIIDPATGSKTGEVKLGGYPEAIQFEKTGSRIFASLPEQNSLVIADRKTAARPVDIPVTWGQQNVSILLDEANQRLLVGTRKPSKLLTFDTKTLKWITENPLSGDPDDMFYDAVQRRVYIISGSAVVVPDRVGLVWVVSQADPDHYIIRQKVITAVGAKTGLFVPELNRLYVAIPRVGEHAAEVRVYQTK